MQTPPPKKKQEMEVKLCKELTLSDHSLQPDDVGVVKLPHDRGLTQKVSSLLVHITTLKGLYCHRDVHPAWYTQTATADFSKFTYRTQ